MADVDMTDVPPSTAVVKKKGGAVADGEANGKKKFEVKKVSRPPAAPAERQPC